MIASSFHEHICHRHFLDHLEQQPEDAGALVEILRALQDHPFWSRWADIMVQIDRRLRLPDAFAVYRILSLLLDGKLAMAEIVVGAKPGPDRDERGNNAKLTSLPDPFRATFRSGMNDDDGRLSWNEPILMTRHPIAVPDQMATTPEDVEIPAGNLPLEVGRTQASRTLAHVAQERGVARWPYGSESLFILHIIGPLYG